MHLRGLHGAGPESHLNLVLGPGEQLDGAVLAEALPVHLEVHRPVVGLDFESNADFHEAGDINHRAAAGSAPVSPPPQKAASRGDRDGEGEEEEEGGGRGGAAGSEPAQPFPKAADDIFVLPSPANHGAASVLRIFSPSPCSGDICSCSDCRGLAGGNPASVMAALIPPSFPGRDGGAVQHHGGGQQRGAVGHDMCWHLPLSPHPDSLIVAENKQPVSSNKKKDNQPTNHNVSKEKDL